MGRQDAVQQPPDSFVPSSLCRFIVKLLLQSNPPEQRASTISRRVCPQTLCLPLRTLSPSAHANWLNGSNANKEVACAASLRSRPWAGGSWEGTCPNHKAPSFEKEGLTSGSTESRRGSAAQSKERGWGSPSRHMASVVGSLRTNPQKNSPQIVLSVLP